MKSALITGANKGIGLETTKQLLKKGLFVYLGSRDIEKGNAIVNELNNNGLQNVKAIELDVTKPDTILSAKNIIEKEQGCLDILINNAGISGIVPQNALETGIDKFKEVFEVNLYGVISITQTFIGLLQKSSEPRIVNVSTSVGSLSLQSNPNWQAYDYAKYATSIIQFRFQVCHECVYDELRQLARLQDHRQVVHFWLPPSSYPYYSSQAVHLGVEEMRHHLVHQKGHLNYL